jgi:predicted lipoprotein with Yx(FWY)xxD motif
MRKSGWAAATGIGSLVLLLAACGGSPGSNSAAGSASSAPLASGGPSGTVPSTAPASSATAAATATKSAGSTASAKPHKSVGPLPSGNDQSIPPRGTTVMIVQKSAVGYVLAEASHMVVYTYSKDKKGGKPTCTGTCAETWLPATGTPQASPAAVFPGQFGLVTGAGGVKQITYDGHPLYLLKGAKALAVTGNGQGGVWHVVPLSASDIRV